MGGEGGEESLTGPPRRAAIFLFRVCADARGRGQGRKGRDFGGVRRARRWDRGSTRTESVALMPDESCIVTPLIGFADSTHFGFWDFGPARTGVLFSGLCTNDPKPFGTQAQASVKFACPLELRRYNPLVMSSQSVPKVLFLPISPSTVCGAGQVISCLPWPT